MGVETMKMWLISLIFVFVLAFPVVAEDGGEIEVSEKVEVEETSDPIEDILFFPFKIVGEIFSGSGDYTYDYDNRPYGYWYSDTYSPYPWYYWDDPFYYRGYDRYWYYKGWRPYRYHRFHRHYFRDPC